MAMLALLGIVFFIGVQVAILYGLVPYVLMNVLQYFGHDISFWLSMGICLLVYLTVSLLKGLFN